MIMGKKEKVKEACILLYIMEKNLTRGRSMHLMHENSCEKKSHNNATELRYLL